jgi:hypothetical protein
MEDFMTHFNNVFHQNFGELRAMLHNQAVKQQKQENMIKELLAGIVVSSSTGIVKSSSQGSEEPSPVENFESAGNAKSSGAAGNAELSQATGIADSQQPKDVQPSSAPGSNEGKSNQSVEGSQKFPENLRAMPRTSTPLSKRPRYEDDEEFVSEEEVSPYGE